MVSQRAEIAAPAERHAPSVPAPSCKRLFTGFLGLGATAFGGPACVAEMRKMTVARQRWLSASEFDEGVALSQVLPGATAVQCAAYTGLRLRGFGGALLACLGFCLPAFLLMLAASAFYSRAIALLDAQATLRGFHVAVIAIVAWSAFGLARTQINTVLDLALVGWSALLLLGGCHPVLVVAATAMAGTLRPWRRDLVPKDVHGAQAPDGVTTQAGLFILSGAVALAVLFLVSPGLASLGSTMMRIDALAFGGGFAALPLMHDEFVRSRAALSADTFMDGIALGQVTPGPIVITATFIGYRVHGLIGAVVASAGIFFPSFALVVAVGPCFGQLQRSPRFQAATRAASLAFIGLLISVALQFVRSLSWTNGLIVLALASLAGLRVGIRAHWIVLACGLLATAMRRFGVF